MPLLYLDATTAGFLLQVVLGGIAGALVVVSIFWQRVKFILTRTKSILVRKPYESESEIAD